jgi:hypothetical protein
VPALNPGPATADPVARYLATFDRLRARKRWSTETATFRFVALAMGAAGTDIDYDHLEQVATGLRKRARWTSPLKSQIRYVVAAMIVRRGLSPQDVHARVFETRDAFKAPRLPSRGTGPTLAALLLALRAEGRAVPARQVERLASIYRRWRKDHFWLTSANDLPAAALHAGRDEASRWSPPTWSAPTRASGSGRVATTRWRCWRSRRRRRDAWSAGCWGTATASAPRSRGPPRTWHSRSPRERGN